MADESQPFQPHLLLSPERDDGTSLSTSLKSNHTMKTLANRPFDDDDSDKSAGEGSRPPRYFDEWVLLSLLLEHPGHMSLTCPCPFLKGTTRTR
jgi:hypothetical protein